MKKGWIALIVGILGIVMIIGLYYWTAPNYAADTVKSMTLVTLPSPPKYKTITERDDIEACLDYLHSLKKSPAFDFGKGWWFMIRINSNTTISFSGEYVSFDGRTYKIKDPEYEDTLRALYDNMKYEEKAW